MKQYCRYCSHCCYGDIPYCEIKKQTMSEQQIKKVNNCNDFEFNEIDVINGGIYKEREKKNKEDKINIFDFVEENK